MSSSVHEQLIGIESEEQKQEEAIDPSNQHEINYKSEVARKFAKKLGSNSDQDELRTIMRDVEQTHNDLQQKARRENSSNSESKLQQQISELHHIHTQIVKKIDKAMQEQQQLFKDNVNIGDKDKMCQTPPKQTKRSSKSEELEAVENNRHFEEDNVNEEDVPYTTTAKDMSSSASINNSQPCTSYEIEKEQHHANLGSNSQISETLSSYLDVLININGILSAPVTCPTNDQQNTTTTPPTNNANQRRNNQQGGNRPSHNNNNNNGGDEDNNGGSDGDGDGDGDDEKGGTANNIDSVHCLNCQQLLQIIQLQHDTINNLVAAARNHSMQQQQHQQQQIVTMKQMNKLTQENAKFNSIAKKLQQLPLNFKRKRPKTGNKSSNLSRESDKNLKQKHGLSIKEGDEDEYYYEPPSKTRAYKNISISTSFISKIKSKTENNFDDLRVKCYVNHKRNKCKCDPLKTWMDVDIAMQFDDYNISKKTKNGDIKVFNHGFVDKQTNEDVLCVIESVQQQDLNEMKDDGCNGRSKINYPWNMKPQLFTKKMIMHKFEFGKDKLPEPVRNTKVFSIQLSQKASIKACLGDAEKLNELIDTTKWSKVKIFSKINNKRRISLSLTKEEFIKDLKDTNTFDDYTPYIPIVLFRKNDVYEIHYVAMITINNSYIGISMILKDDKVIVSGIHIDMEYIQRQHQWISLDHVECKCLDDCFTKIDHLQIGNVDGLVNKLKDLKGKNKQLEREKENLEISMMNLKQLASDDNSFGITSADTYITGQ